MSALEQYRQPEAKLARCRLEIPFQEDGFGGVVDFGASPEEDKILDEMDSVWAMLSPAERDELNRHTRRAYSLP